MVPGARITRNTLMIILVMVPGARITRDQVCINLVYVFNHVYALFMYLTI